MPRERGPLPGRTSQDVPVSAFCPPLRGLRHALALAALLGAAGPALAQPPAPTPTQDDPAVVRFDGELGLLLVPIKPAATDDYEAVIRVLQAGLAASTDDARRAQAAGWRVYKAAETDAKGSVLYIHLVTTPVADADYRPSVVLEALVDGLDEALLAKYRDAHAGPPSRLTLTEFAHMAVAPVPD